MNSFPRMEEAIEQLLELLKHEPGSIDALFTLGVFYQVQWYIVRTRFVVWLFPFLKNEQVN